MHRSATSLVAALCAQADVHMGARQLGPQPDNPRGFFEDSEFVRFHEGCLDRRGLTYARPGRTRIAFDDDERQQALALVESRRGHAAWGWKDPRTCLFLDEWRAILPGCRYLVVYRHPLDVIGSLLRRGETLPVRDLTAGLEMWTTYNRAIIEFLRKRPRTAVVLEAGAVVRSVEALCEVIGRLGLGAVPQDVRPLIQPEGFSSLPGKTELEPLLDAVAPEAMRLFKELRAASDLPLEDVEPCDTVLQSQLRKLAGLASLATGDQRRVVGSSLLAAGLSILDQRIGDQLRVKQAAALRSESEALALDMRVFMAVERAQAAEVLANSNAVQLEHALARASDLEFELATLREYTKQVEAERNRYRRRWPPYVTKRSVQKLTAWYLDKYWADRRRRGFDASARVCALMTGLPRPDDVAPLQGHLARQTHRLSRLLLPAECSGLRREVASETDVCAWWGPDIQRITAGHHYVLVVHPEYYGAGPFWSPVIIELLAAALDSDPQIAAIVLRSGEGPPRIGTPNHLYETDVATLDTWAERTVAAIVRQRDMAETFGTANPGESRDILPMLRLLIQRGRRVLIAPQTFCATREATEAASSALASRLPARPKAPVRGLYVTQWIECGGADKGIVDLLSRVNPEIVDFSIMTTVAAQHGWQDRIAPHVRQVIHLGEYLPLPPEQRFPEFIVEYVRRRGIGLVHIMHSFLGYDALPALKAALPGVRVVDQCHILEPPHIMEGGHPAYSSRRYQQYLDHRTVTSQWLKRYLVEEHQVPTDRISVIYTGVDARHEFDPEQYPPGALRRRLGLSPETKIVLFIGRLYWQKRPWLVARVADEVQQQRPDLDVRFVLVGSGPEQPRLAQGRVVLAGELPHGAPALRDADLMLLPSGHEGLAYVSYEAMAMGVPQICTDVNGQSELVTPDCGVLIPPEPEDATVQEATRAVIELLDDPQRRQAMGQAGRQRVLDHFGLDGMVQAYEGLYRKLIDGGS